MSHTDWETIERVLQKLTPAEKLELIERVARLLRANALPAPTSTQQHAMQTLLRKLAALPVENPADGFSARDHDKLLYGESS